MYSFIVLGQVPGTQITITFTMWLEMCALFTALWLLVEIRSARMFGSSFETRESNVGSALLSLAI